MGAVRETEKKLISKGGKPGAVRKLEKTHIQEGQQHLESLAKKFIRQQKSNAKTIKSLQLEAQAQTAEARARISMQKEKLQAAKKSQNVEMSALKRLQKCLSK